MEIDVCPRWLLAMLGIPERSREHVAFFLSTFFVMAFLPFLRYVPHLCLFQKVLGIACPGCGISRSLLAILHLRATMAWVANPAGFALAFMFLFQIVARPIAIGAPEMSGLVSKVSRHSGNAALTCLVLVWITRLL